MGKKYRFLNTSLFVQDAEVCFLARGNFGPMSNLSDENME